MSNHFSLIPIRTYTLTIDTNLSKAVAMHCLRGQPLIRNISFRVTRETPAGLRAMFFPNTDLITSDLQDDLTGVIERALDPVDGTTKVRVFFD